jgi:phosphoesterase RecJ-like protein
MTPLFPDVDWQPVIEAIEQAGRIALVTHRNPDGDGIGSELALYDMLAARGRNVSIYNRDGIPRAYAFLAHADQVRKGDWATEQNAPDLVICLDCGSSSRLGMPQTMLNGVRLVNIDHHASNRLFGDINIVDQRYCATGAMIYDLLLAVNYAMTEASASAIYTAVLTDTACFRLATTNAGVYRLAADLVEAGARPWPISVAVYESRTPAGLRILKACLDTLEIHNHGRSAWIYVNRDMYEEAGADVEDTESLIDYARSIGGVEVAVMIRSDERNDQWKVNFRAKTDADVGAIASKLGGGGHRHAAGCLLNGSFDEVQAIVRQAVSRIFD